MTEDNFSWAKSFNYLATLLANKEPDQLYNEVKDIYKKLIGRPLYYGDSYYYKIKITANNFKARPEIDPFSILNIITSYKELYKVLNEQDFKDEKRADFFNSLLPADENSSKYKITSSVFNEIPLKKITDKSPAFFEFPKFWKRPSVELKSKYLSTEGTIDQIKNLSVLFNKAMEISSTHKVKIINDLHEPISEFCEEYDICNTFSYTKDEDDTFLPCALYWINAYYFMPLNSNIIRFLCNKNLITSSFYNKFEYLIPNKLEKGAIKLSGSEYLDLCNICRKELQSGEYAYTSIPELIFHINKSETEPIAMAKAKEKTRNRIIFGAPGTGKSYKLHKEVEARFKKNNVERVTFHPDYTYSQFFGTFKPTSDKNGKIEYKFVPGPFMRTYANAKRNPNINYVLIIEEINRARIAGVFGDIFQLLDRNKDGSSVYNISVSEEVKAYLHNETGDDTGKMSIPPNMYIWATMNSADQGVFPMDTAFKRRWSFEYIDVDAGAEERGKNNEPAVADWHTELNGRTVYWNVLRQKINDLLSGEKLNEDKLMGAFFLSSNDLCPNADHADYGNVEEARFKDVFKNKVLMYLFEDAAKPFRTHIFNTETNRFSKLCADFDKIGVSIFKGITPEMVEKRTPDDSVVGDTIHEHERA